MNTPVPNPHRPELSPADWQQIDQVCDEFELACKSGKSPDLRSFSQRLSDRLKQPCLIDLVILDAFYRQQHSLPGGVDSTQANMATLADQSSSLWSDYLERFPELKAVECPPEFSHPEPPAIIDNRFRIRKLRATGGLGQVSIADDLQIGREVAIKEIRLQYSGHEASRERFMREAEITGRLEHPFIVPVYSMGQQADGKPYYAMRLVRGQSLYAAIENYHQENLANVDARFRGLLKRLVDVCEAVEYAHSRGVIHRDIKPDNIMLGDYGESFLVDWGLAKVLDQPEPDFPLIEPSSGTSDSSTRAGAVLGTPGYMSPEQAAGNLDAVAEPSDIYSLGATLLQLVTGQVPGRILPGSTSTLGPSDSPFRQVAKVLAPLVAISQKAMVAEPANRYRSARAFADDIEAFLADRPVSVFADPVEVRLGRWLRQHRGLAGAVTAAVGLAFFGLLIFSWITGNHAVVVQSKNKQLDELIEREIELRTDAQQSEKRTADALNYLVGALRSPDPNLDGREVKVVQILDQAVDRLAEDFAGDPLMLAKMLDAIGSTYTGLGQFATARELVERAHSIFETSAGEQDRHTLRSAAKLADLYQRTDDPRAAGLIADVVKTSRHALGDGDPETAEFRRIAAIIQMQGGNPSRAVAELESLVPQFEATFGAASSKTISLLNDLANAYYFDGQADRAVVISENVYKTRLEERGPRSLVALTNGSNYANHLLRSKDQQRAKMVLQDLLRNARESLGDGHFQTLAIMSQLGSVYINENDLSRGIELLKESMERSKRAYGPKHSRTLVSANGLALAYLESADYENAAKHLKKVFDDSVETRGIEHPETLTVANNLASAYRLNGDYDAAIEIFEKTIEAQQRVQGSHYPNRIRSILNLAATLQTAGRPADSQALCRQAFELAEQHLGDDSRQAQTALSLEAMALLELEEFEKAKTVLQAGLESRTRTIPDHWLRYNTMSLLGEAHLKLGELAEAEPLLVEAYAKMKAQESKMSKRSRTRIDQARQRLAELYDARQMPDKAKEFRD